MFTIIAILTIAKQCPKNNLKPELSSKGFEKPYSADYEG